MRTSIADATAIYNRNKISFRFSTLLGKASLEEERKNQKKVDTGLNWNHVSSNDTHLNLRNEKLSTVPSIAVL